MKLIDACELIVDCPHSSAKDEGVGIALIRTPNVGKGRLVLDNVHRVSEVVYQERIARAVPTPGDLILAREAPVGNVAIIQEGQKVCLGQRVVLIRCNKSIAVPDFLVYYLLSAPIQHKLLNQSNETTVAHLNVANIRNLEIDLPSLETQRRIANILSSLDRKIELNNKINAQLEEMAQTLFKHWFVDFGPFKDGKFVESELGMIPEGWRVFSLPELADDYSGYSYKGAELQRSNSAMVTIKNFDRNGSFKTDGYKEIKYSEKLKDSQRIKLMDVLVACTDLTQNAEVIGNPILILSDAGYQELIMSMDLSKLVPKGISSSLLYGLLKDSRFKAFALGYVNGTTVLHMSRKVFKDYTIALPKNLESLERISKNFEGIYKRIAVNIEENRKLASLRDTLLPKLMSGEINLEDYGGE